jgi:ABC-type lipoprotein release transport system permease subunit
LAELALQVDHDPMTFAAVALLMVAGAFASAIGPAWRAARVEPATALRSE